MAKFANHKAQQIAEIFFWVLIIILTFVVTTRFSWDVAASILQYLSICALVVSGYFYLSNRALYNESKNKTDKIIEKQKQLQNRQKTIDLIFNNSTDGIIVLNQDKEIEEFSAAMQKITGYLRKDVLGRNAQSILKFSAEKNHSLLPDLMFTIPSKKNRTQYVKNSLISKEGKIVQIEASHTMIHDSNPKSKQVLALAVIRDITYEKALMERDKEFITVTSHQLNTPLSIIRGYASLLANGKGGEINEKQSSFVKEILSSTEKMIDLVGNMLSISRIEQEKIKLDITDINLKDLVGSLVASLQNKADSKDIRLDCKPIEDNLLIMADQDRIRQALSNIIENAVKYTPKGRVTVSVIDRPEVIDITVADTGIGIPAKELDKIGTRFFRSQNAIDVDNHGSGLGIYIAQTIIDKHRGYLKIDSVEGQFTKVTLTLPKKQKVE